MLDLEFIKGYLRLDGEEDDDFLQLLLDEARIYVKNAIGFFDEKDPRIRVIVLRIIAFRYENRMATMVDAMKCDPTIKSEFLQLELESDLFGDLDGDANGRDDD